MWLRAPLPQLGNFKSLSAPLFPPRDSLWWNTWGGRNGGVSFWLRQCVCVCVLARSWPRRTNKGRWAEINVIPKGSFAKKFSWYIRSCQKVMRLWAVALGSTSSTTDHKAFSKSGLVGLAGFRIHLCRSYLVVTVCPRYSADEAKHLPTKVPVS